MGTNAAVAIAVERGRIRTVPAVALAGDEINEDRFLSLLHKSPQCVTAIDPLQAVLRRRGPGTPALAGVYGFKSG
jgi:hypothetical protein